MDAQQHRQQNLRRLIAAPGHQPDDPQRVAARAGKLP